MLGSRGGKTICALMPPEKIRSAPNLPLAWRRHPLASGAATLLSRSRHPKAQCSPASLVLPAGRLLRLPLEGPDGVSSGALNSPSPNTIQLSILHTTLGLPPFAAEKSSIPTAAIERRGDLVSFLSATLFLKRGKLWA